MREIIVKNKREVNKPMQTGRDKREETAKGAYSALPFIIVALLLMVASCVFSVLCLSQVSVAFIQQRLVLFSVLSCLLWTSFFILCVVLACKQKETLFKTCFSVFILIVFCLVLLYILLDTGFFMVIRDKQSLQEYLETKGAWMPVLYVVLQYLQVVILPIPSTVSTLAGVALFGPLQTLLYSLIGIMLGSFTAFFIGRKLGYKAVAWIVGKETLEKWQAKLKGKDNLLLSMMFVLPVFPDDVLCFIAGLSSMSTRYFAIMLTISRILAISVTCYSIDLIPFNTWWGLSIWAVFFALVIVVFTLAYKNLDKIQAWMSNRFGKNKK